MSDMEKKNIIEIIQDLKDKYDEIRLLCPCAKTCMSIHISGVSELDIDRVAIAFDSKKELANITDSSTYWIQVKPTESFTINLWEK